jgi:hypothetical protein
MPDLVRRGHDGRGYPVISTAGRDRTGASFGSINDEFSYSRPDELADRSATLLASEEVPDLSPPEAGLIALFNDRRG